MPNTSSKAEVGTTTSTEAVSTVRPEGSLNVFKTLFQRATFYPAEYVLMLLTSLSILISFSLLSVAILGQWFDVDAGSWGHASTIYLIASLLVTVPVHLALYWRVRHTDHATLTSLSEHVANGALGIYLLFTVGTIISLTTMLVFGLLRAAMGGEYETKQLLVSSLTLIQAIGWFKYGTWHFMRLRKAHSRPKYYALTIALLTAALVILGLIFPGSVARAAARDAVKEKDLAVIEQSISDFVQKKNQLPAGLDELDSLDRTVAKRIDSYSYQPKGQQYDVYNYEICATFDRKAGSGRDSGFGYTSHSKGRQCFERTSGGYSQYYPTSESSGSSLQNYLEPTTTRTIQPAY